MNLSSDQISSGGLTPKMLLAVLVIAFAMCIPVLSALFAPSLPCEGKYVAISKFVSFAGCEDPNWTGKIYNPAPPQQPDAQPAPVQQPAAGQQMQTAPACPPGLVASPPPRYCDIPTPVPMLVYPQRGP